MRTVLLCVLATACATLAEPAGGDQNIPTSGAGPFRKLAGAEVLGAAPYLLDDSTALFREPAALPLPQGVALYVVMQASSGHDVIARTRADDGRTFYGAAEDVGHKPLQVLAADQTWESTDLSHPSALAVGSSVWLYYASNGSVGLAQSADGLTFTKVANPVLAADARGPVTSASVAQLPDGTFDMMYAQAGSIYEATSSDGLTWQRAPDAILAPAGDAFDSMAVADPCVFPRMTAAGRLQVRVLYTGYAPNEGGVTSAIGFAARYGSVGALTRAPAPVYSVSKNERAPAVFAQDSSSLLYVEQDSQDGTHRAIAGAVSPANLTLPSPSPYPPSP
jgi:hypothetical protein